MSRQRTPSLALHHQGSFSGEPWTTLGDGGPTCGTGPGPLVGTHYPRTPALANSCRACHTRAVAHVSGSSSVLACFPDRRGLILQGRAGLHWALGIQGVSAPSKLPC